MARPSRLCLGALCNLDCTYCYYLHKEELLGQPRQPRMADEMLERHIRQYIEAQTGDAVVFSGQGGELTCTSSTRSSLATRRVCSTWLGRMGLLGS